VNTGVSIVARKSTSKPKGSDDPKANAAESRRFGTLVRLGEDVANDAKVVASLRGTTMAELLTETLRPILKKALADELRKRVEK
jgi:hypothetical protein